MQITIDGSEVIEKKVKPQGNGAMVLVPKQWIGKLVKIILLDLNFDTEKKRSYPIQNITFYGVNGEKSGKISIGDNLNGKNIESIVINDEKNIMEITFIDMYIIRYVPLRSRTYEIVPLDIKKAKTYEQF